MNKTLYNNIQIILDKQDLLDLIHIYKRVILKAQREITLNKINLAQEDLKNLVDFSVTLTERIKKQKGIN